MSPAVDLKLPDPNSFAAPTQQSNGWWYAAGAAAVLGVGWLALSKFYLHAPATNPAERKQYRVIYDQPAPLNLVNAVIRRARDNKLKIEIPRLDTSVVMILVSPTDNAGRELVKHRFFTVWRETLIAEYEEKWGKDWYLKGGRDSWLPEFV